MAALAGSQSANAFWHINTANQHITITLIPCWPAINSRGSLWPIPINKLAVYIAKTPSSLPTYTSLSLWYTMADPINMLAVLGRFLRINWQSTSLKSLMYCQHTHHYHSDIPWQSAVHSHQYVGSPWPILAHKLAVCIAKIASSLPTHYPTLWHQMCWHCWPRWPCW